MHRYTIVVELKFEDVGEFEADEMVSQIEEILASGKNVSGEIRSVDQD